MADEDGRVPSTQPATRLAAIVIGPDAADTIGHTKPSRGWITATGIGLAASIVGHAILIGSGIAKFESMGMSETETLVVPIDVVPDPTTGRTNKEQKLAPAPPIAPSAPPAPPAPTQPAPPESLEQPAGEAPPPPSGPSEPALSPPRVAGASVAIETTMTKQELEALRAQVQRCWTVPPGWADPRQVSVTIDFRMNRDGTVAGDPTLIEFPASPYGKAAAQNALRAVLRCGPYHLPAGKYNEWREVQIRLTPVG